MLVQVLSEAWALRQVNPVLAKKSVLIELHFDSIKFSNGVDLTTREDLERYMVDPAYKQAVTDNSKVQMEIVECVYKYLLEMRAFSGTPYFALLKAANREHAKDLLLASQELKTRGNNSGPPR